MNQNDITNISIVTKIKSTIRAYTTRWNSKEYEDLKRISTSQEIPITRLLRIALLYYYASNNEWEAFENVVDVAKITKQKVLDDLNIARTR